MAQHQVIGKSWGRKRQRVASSE